MKYLAALLLISLTSIAWGQCAVQTEHNPSDMKYVGDVHYISYDKGENTTLIVTYYGGYTVYLEGRISGPREGGLYHSPSTGKVCIEFSDEFYCYSVGNGDKE
jgi:hypothetical protein